ncbi:hypothetical protein AYI69_g8273 [Smittium culicis]|uniref:LITAF domain-containing protein n=2 Tax=Smittium culicis TaxID=133412 RepID=A0A1R1XKT8_9FUNG|nr:hypothetical protein AYI69_g8273 [Smittium culicis]
MMTNSVSKDERDFIQGYEHNSNANQAITNYRTIQDVDPQSINQDSSRNAAGNSTFDNTPAIHNNYLNAPLPQYQQHKFETPNPGSNYVYANAGNSVIISHPPANDVNFMKASGIPANITCPVCKHNIVTIIKRKNGTKTWIAVIGVGLIFWPLMWVPLVMKSLKKKVHICPNCKYNLGDKILIQVNQLTSSYTPIYQ